MGRLICWLSDRKPLPLWGQHLMMIPGMLIGWLIWSGLNDLFGKAFMTGLIGLIYLNASVIAAFSIAYFYHRRVEKKELILWQHLALTGIAIIFFAVLMSIGITMLQDVRAGRVN